MNDEFLHDTTPFGQLIAALVLNFDYALEGSEGKVALENIFRQLRQNAHPDFLVTDEVALVRFISEWIVREWEKIPKEMEDQLAEMIEAMYDIVSLKILPRMLVEMDDDWINLNIIYFHKFEGRNPTDNLSEQRTKDILGLTSQEKIEDIRALSKEQAQKKLGDVVWAYTKKAMGEDDTQ